MALYNADLLSRKEYFMHLSLALLTVVEWGSLLVAAGLAFRAALMDADQVRRSRRFICIAILLIAVVLIPAVCSAWSVFGGFPLSRCPECSPTTIIAIWSTMLFTVALVMAPLIFVTYLLSLSRG